MTDGASTRELGVVWGWPVRRWILLACAVHVALGLLLYDPTLFTGGDNAGYMILGESLRTGQGYLDLHLPGSPVHTKYPPLYPGLLAVLGWFGGLQLFKLASLALTTGAVALAGGLGRRWLGPRAGIVAALMVAVNPVLVSYSHWVLSEAPFVFLVLLSLYGFEREAEAGSPDARPEPAAGGAGRGSGDRAGPAGSAGPWRRVALAAAVGAFLTRTAGLPLLAAAVLHPALGKRWGRAAWSLAAAGVAAGGWALFQRLGAPDQAGYLAELLMVNPYDPAEGSVGAAGLVARTAENFWRYAAEVLPLSLTGGGGEAGPVGAAGGLLLAGLAAAGWARRSLERLGVPELFLLLYLGLICAWPSVWTDRRFLLPAVPLLLLYGLLGARLAGRALAERAGAVGEAAGAAAVGPALLAVAVGVSGLLDTGRRVPERVRCLAGWRSGAPCVPAAYASFYAAAEWTAEHTPDDAVVVNRKPRLFYWISRREGDVYPYVSEPAVVLDALEAAGADYVVLDAVSATTPRYLVPAVEAHPSRFEVVYREGRPPTWVLRFRRATGTARSPLPGDRARPTAAGPEP